MSRFYADITGGRGTATRQGHTASGIRGHIRGWRSGVSVVGRANGERDEFDVYATGGSGGYSSRYIGVVYLDESSGAVEFVPADPRD
jgi:hypothetical protein